MVDDEHDGGLYDLVEWMYLWLFRVASAIYALGCMWEVAVLDLAANGTKSCMKRGGMNQSIDRWYICA